MHRSRLAGFIIDCQSDDLEAAARFWSEALGLELRPAAAPADPKYRTALLRRARTARRFRGPRQHLGLKR